MTTTGVELIAAERKRQIEKGYTPEHDMRHQQGVLVLLGTPFMERFVSLSPDVEDREKRDEIDAIFKSLEHSAKRKNEVECLAIIGAFCAAEIDRLQHAAGK